MKKKIIVGVIVLLGAAWSGGAWYTGKQAEEALRAAVATLNAKGSLSDGVSVKIEQAAYERGVFSSNVRYRVTLSDRDNSGKFNGEYEIVAKLDHGPLPLPELMSGQWRPVFMVAQAELVETPAAQKWFAATKGAKPLSSSSRVGYNGNISGKFALAPLESVNDKSGAILKFSGMQGEFSYDNAQAALSAKIDDLSVKFADSTQFALQGLALEGSGKRGASGLYLGTQKVNIKNLAGLWQGTLPVKVVDTELVTKTTEVDNNLNIHTDLNVGMVQAKGQDIAGVKLSTALTHLDVKALKIINDTYQQAAERASKKESVDSDDLGLTPPEEVVVRTNAVALLNGSPNFSISPLALQTPHGVVSLQLNLTAKAVPDSDNVFELDRLGKLDANLQVPKASLTDLSSAKLQLLDGASADEASKMSEFFVQVIESAVTAKKLAKVDKDNITATLSYAEGKVNFNGEQMSPPDFFQRIFNVM